MNMPPAFLKVPLTNGQFVIIKQTDFFNLAEEEDRVLEGPLLEDETLRQNAMMIFNADGKPSQGLCSTLEEFIEISDFTVWDKQTSEGFDLPVSLDTWRKVLGVAPRGDGPSRFDPATIALLREALKDFLPKPEVTPKGLDFSELASENLEHCFLEVWSNVRFSDSSNCDSDDDADEDESPDCDPDDPDTWEQANDKFNDCLVFHLSKGDGNETLKWVRNGLFHFMGVLLEETNQSICTGDDDADDAAWDKLVEVDPTWTVGYRAYLFGKGKLAGGHSLRVTLAGTKKNPKLILHWDF